jgi:DNA-binding NarL/FixJ family response regulator
MIVTPSVQRSIYLVHPAETTRSGLALLASANGFMVVGSSANLADAADELTALQPNVLLLSATNVVADLLMNVSLAIPDARIFLIAEKLDQAGLSTYIQWPVHGICSADVNATNLFQSLHFAGSGMWLDVDATEAIRAVLMHAFSDAEGHPIAAPTFTEREQSILRMLIKGATNTQIATQLGISVETVKTYIRRVMDKSGIRNRAALMTHYRRHTHLGKS